MDTGNDVGLLMCNLMLGNLVGNFEVGWPRSHQPNGCVMCNSVGNLWWALGKDVGFLMIIR